jgi:anti-anti-sigma factor
MNNLLLTKEKEENITIELPDDFSGMNVDKYRDQFDSFASSDYKVIILDFSKTEFIDSSGIGAMIFLFKRIEKRGVEMKLLDVNGQPKKLMLLLRVDGTIAFIKTNEIQK